MKAAILRLFRRGIAYLIDSVLVLVFCHPDRFAAAWFGSSAAPWIPFLDYLGIGMTAAYIVGSHWRWGRTLGKRVVGLRVATIKGVSPVPLSVALLRFVPLLVIGIASTAIYHTGSPAVLLHQVEVLDQEAALLDLIVLSWFLVDFAFAAFTGGFRSLHDFIGSSFVTDERAKKQAAEPGATDNPDDAQRLREDH